MQSRNRADAQELHRALDIPSEDVNHTLDSSLAPSHEPVQISPADEAGLCSEGDGGNDVSTVHDPTVDVYLSILADRIDGGSDETQRYRRSIELSPSVVLERSLRM